MEPQIRFVTTSDGVRVAYRAMGRGRPLVFVRGWMSHLEAMWKDASYRSFFEALARIRLVVQYDARGNGLSDRDVRNLGLDALLLDLEAVVDHLNLDTFDLYGQTFGGPIAVAYAAKHPRRVSSLILDGTYARGQDLASPERQAAIVGMIRSLWPAAAKTLEEMTVSEADRQGKPRVSLSEAISRDVAVELYSLAFRIDVTGLLPGLKMPTLVLHRAGSRSIRFGLGRVLASLIPDARFVPLDGTAHNPWQGDAKSALLAIGDFLGEEIELEEPAPTVVPAEAPVTILFTDMEGSTTLTERLGDAKAQELRRTHDSIVRDALKAQGGSETKHTGRRHHGLLPLCLTSH
jgi:pimeloyl-ACP methyl ester carboxylesterase